MFRDAVHQVNRNGVVFCASRGNEGFNNPLVPAIFDDNWVLSVSGTNKDGDFHTSSSSGRGVDVAAPYSSLLVYTTDFFNGSIPDTTSFTWFSGTSSACPHVAGTAALLLSYVNDPNPNYNNLVHEDVEYILQRTADDIELIGVDSMTGYGKLNAGNALHLLQKPLRYVRHFDSDVFPSVKNVSFEGTTNIHLTEIADNLTTGGLFLTGNYQADVYKITATVTHNLAANENIY